MNTTERFGLYRLKNTTMKRNCDYCGKEYEEYDLRRMMFAKGQVRYMCFKCQSKGDNEVKKHKVAGMEKNGLIGDK